jgi:hypothetical protein
MLCASIFMNLVTGNTNLTKLIKNTQKIKVEDSTKFYK